MTFAFDVDEAVTYLRQCDDVMARVIDRVGEFQMTLKSFDRPCEAVTRSIVYQAISTKAAGTIYSRLETEVGFGYDHDDILLLDTETLRAIGLSTNKANAVLGVAQAMRDGDIPTDRIAYDALDDETVEQVFTQVKGIGVWTAQMILMFSLGRQDVMPDGDLGVREGYRRAFQLDDRPTAKTVRTYAQNWSPFRTVAAWYLWRLVDDENGGAF